MHIKTKIVSCHTADSKPVKQEVNRTGILPPLVFPAVSKEREVSNAITRAVKAAKSAVIRKAEATFSYFTKLAFWTLTSLLPTLSGSIVFGSMSLSRGVTSLDEICAGCHKTLKAAT